MKVHLTSIHSKRLRARQYCEFPRFCYDIMIVGSPFPTPPPPPPLFIPPIPIGIPATPLSHLFMPPKVQTRLWLAVLKNKNKQKTMTRPCCQGSVVTDTVTVARPLHDFFQDYYRKYRISFFVFVCLFVFSFVFHLSLLFFFFSSSFCFYFLFCRFLCCFFRQGLRRMRTPRRKRKY